MKSPNHPGRRRIWRYSLKLQRSLLILLSETPLTTNHCWRSPISWPDRSPPAVARTRPPPPLPAPGPGESRPRNGMAGEGGGSSSGSPPPARQLRSRRGSRRWSAAAGEPDGQELPPAPAARPPVAESRGRGTKLEAPAAPDPEAEVSAMLCGSTPAISPPHGQDLPPTPCSTPLVPVAGSRGRALEWWGRGGPEGSGAVDPNRRVTRAKIREPGLGQWDGPRATSQIQVVPSGFPSAQLTSPRHRRPCGSFRDRIQERRAHPVDRRGDTAARRETAFPCDSS